MRWRSRPTPRTGTARPRLAHTARPAATVTPTREREGMEAEGKERAVAHANAAHHEDIGVGRHVVAAVRAGQYKEQADHEGTENIDEQRAPREGGADPARRHKGAPVPRDAAERAADRHPQIGCHAGP